MEQEYLIPRTELERLARPAPVALRIVDLLIIIWALELEIEASGDLDCRGLRDRLRAVVDAELLKSQTTTEDRRRTR
jgi:hypothetical protein